MNKGDLINKVSEVLSSKKEAQAAVDCTIKAITEALSNNDSVTLVGFGTFKTTKPTPFLVPSPFPVPLTVLPSSLFGI